MKFGSIFGLMLLLKKKVSLRYEEKGKGWLYVVRYKNI